jgi:hypothetical protein
MLIPHRGTLAVSFLPQIPAVFGCFSVRFAAVAESTATESPFQRRKCGAAVNPPVMKSLPESS